MFYDADHRAESCKIPCMFYQVYGFNRSTKCTVVTEETLGINTDCAVVALIHFRVQQTTYRIGNRVPGMLLKEQSERI